MIYFLSHGPLPVSCWQLPSRMYKEILVYLHRDVMPHLPDPRRLIDFLTTCCNVGGVIGILALNGLFVLIHKYHL